MTDEEYKAMNNWIADIQNENYASPLAQALLDLEAELVLQEYYASKEYFEVSAWDAPDVLVGEIIEYDSSDLWLDE